MKFLFNILGLFAPLTIATIVLEPVDDSWRGVVLLGLIVAANVIGFAEGRAE